MNQTTVEMTTEREDDTDDVATYNH
jgi:hypothetical protein